VSDGCVADGTEDRGTQNKDLEGYCCTGMGAVQLELELAAKEWGTGLSILALLDLGKVCSVAPNESRSGMDEQAKAAELQYSSSSRGKSGEPSCPKPRVPPDPPSPPRSLSRPHRIVDSSLPDSSTYPRCSASQQRSYLPDKRRWPLESEEEHDRHLQRLC
jgi:hypothetical protein